MNAISSGTGIISNEEVTQLVCLDKIIAYLENLETSGKPNNKKKQLELYKRQVAFLYTSNN